MIEDLVDLNDAKAEQTILLILLDLIKAGDVRVLPTIQQAINHNAYIVQLMVSNHSLMKMRARLAEIKKIEGEI